MSLSADENNINVTANKAIKVISSSDVVEIIAEKEILLTSGGAYIRIKDGNIEIHAPGTIDQKGAEFSIDGPTCLNESIAAQKNAVGEKTKIKIKFMDAEGNTPTGEPIRFTHADGSEHSLVLDENGSGLIENVSYGQFTTDQPKRKDS